MAKRVPPGFRRVFMRELRQIADRPALALMLGPVPLALMLLMSAIFYNGLPTDLPIAVVDEDNTTLSRRAVRMVDATPEIAVAAHMSNLAEAKTALVAGDVYGVVLIPEDMESDLLQGRRPEIVTFYNNQLLTVGGIVSRGTQAALGTFSAGVSMQVRIARGEPLLEAREAINPVPVQQSPLFNPALDYVQFLLAAAMPTVLHIFMGISAALAMARDRHSRAGMARLVAQGGSVFKAVAGKLAPYALAFLLMVALADAILFGFFGAPFRGSIELHVTYTVLFVLSCLCLGAFAGMLAGDTVGALGMTGFLTAPAFGFAGITFPRALMNNFSVIWGALLPLTPYLQLRTDQVIRGAPVDISIPAIGWQVLQLVAYGGVMLLLVHKAAAPPRPEREEVKP
ncbi:ABC transporter permease [Lutimaribacter marinistellae]|uniref:ABC transporter permease n=1 Tax=Lutimaribacter marinistellae TaxID=1820329 RepID=A0ABV7TF57_9RHOB